MARPGEVARRSLEHFGELTARNLLDWMVALGTGTLLAAMVYQLGGGLEYGKPQVTLSLVAGLLLFLHGLSWLVKGEDAEVHPYAWLVLPLLVWAGLRTWWWSAAPWLGETVFWTWLAVATVWWVVLHQVRSKEQISLVVGAAALAGLLSVAVAMYQVLHRPGWLPLGERGPATEILTLPVSGSFAQASHLAGYLTLVIPILFLATVMRRLRTSLRILLGVVTALLLGGLVLAARPQDLVAVVAVCALLPLFVLRRWVHQVLGVGLALGLILAVASWLGGKDAAGSAGLGLFLPGMDSAEWPGSWQAAWAMDKASPHLGHGLGAFAFRVDSWVPAGFLESPLHAGNQALHLFAELGWPGWVLAGAPLLGIVLRSGQVWRETPFLAIPIGGETRVTPQAKLLLGWALLGTVVLTWGGLTSDLLHSPAVLVLAAILYAFAAQRLTRQRWRPAPSRHWRLLFAGALWLVGAALAIRGSMIGQGTHEFRGACLRLESFLSHPRLASHDEGHLNRAQAGFERALGWIPEHAEARARLGATRLARIRFRPEERVPRADFALADLDLARAQAKHWRFELYRAVALARMGRPATEILAACEAAVQAAPHQPDAWYVRAAVLAQLPGRESEVKGCLSEVFKLDPSHKNGRILASRLTSP